MLYRGIQCFAGALAVTFALNASAAEQERQIGNFEVSVEKDRFGDNDKAVAMVTQGGSALAVRCLQNELSFAVGDLGFGEGRYEEGMPAEIKIRVDDGPIISTTGDGLNDKAIEVADKQSAIASMVGAHEIAFRVTARDITSDKVFTLHQSADAIAVVLKACHVATPNQPVTK